MIRKYMKVLKVELLKGDCSTSEIEVIDPIDKHEWTCSVSKTRLGDTPEEAYVKHLEWALEVGSEEACRIEVCPPTSPLGLEG